MIARFTGGALGLLAFTITIAAGLYVQNPVTVTLSRGIWALLLFCGIGLVLGAAAGLVLRENEASREEQMLREFREGPHPSEPLNSLGQPTNGQPAEPAATAAGGGGVTG